MENKVSNYKKTHAINSWVSLIMSSLIVIFVFISVVRNLITLPTEQFPEVGTKTFRMFTVLSNMFVAITSAMCIPFAVEGIREKNYHLPRWIVNLTYISVTAISLTFVTTITVLGPTQGYVLMLFKRSNLFVHTLVPIFSITAFLFVNTYHTIKFKTLLYAMIPVFLYASVYFISAIIVGEDNGGWRDHYRFTEIMPWYLALVVMMSAAFGLGALIRFVHNKMHQIDKVNFENYYMNDEEFNHPTIEEAVKHLANENKKYDTAGELIVPRRIIKMFIKKYESNKPLHELCSLYVDEYYK